MGQSGEFGLRVSVPVPPIFESLLAGRLCPDKAVADWGMPAVAFDCVEESRVRALGYCDAFAFDGGGEWFRCHGLFYCLSSGVVVSKISCMSSSPFFVSCHLQHGRLCLLVPFRSTRWVYPARSSSTRRLLRLCGVSRYSTVSAMSVNRSCVIGFFAR